MSSTIPQTAIWLVAPFWSVILPTTAEYVGLCWLLTVTDDDAATLAESTATDDVAVSDDRAVEDGSTARSDVTTIDDGATEGGDATGLRQSLHDVRHQRVQLSLHCRIPIGGETPI